MDLVNFLRPSGTTCVATPKWCLHKLKWVAVARAYYCDCTSPQVSRGCSCGMDLRAIIRESASEIELELKDKQVIALEAILGGSHMFVSLPTGYGKSIIYTLLPRSFDKLRG